MSLPPRRSRLARRPAPRPHLQIESLEDRCLLAAFTAGDLVVLRPNGATSVATAIFLDEYNPSGSLIQSVALPTAASGSNHILTQSGSAGSEGALNRSANGEYLTLVGYDATLGTAGVSSGTAGRVVGRVDANGNIDTSTLVDGYSGNNIRSAVTDDGTHFWTAGPSATGGTHYLTLGSNGATGSSVQVNTVNDRVVEIIGGQLYASTNTGSNTGVNTIGTGLPTTSGQTMTLLPGVTATNAFAFVLLDRDPSVAGYDTLYVADQTAGLLKYSFDGSSWTARGSVAGVLTGLTGTVSGANAVLYATLGTGTANKLVSFTDSAAFNASISAGTFTTLAIAPAGTSFKGLAFAPATQPDLSVGVAGPGSASVGTPFNYTLTATNSGTADATGVSVQFTLPSGLTYNSAAGTDSNGTAFTVSQSGGVVTLSGGTIKAGSSVTLTVSVTAPSAGVYTAPAWAAVIDPGNTVAEFDESNNKSPNPVVVSFLPDLTVDVTGPAVASVNTPYNYTLTAKSTGNAGASGVTIFFILPAGVTYNSAGVNHTFTAVQSAGVVTFSNGTLAIGDTATLTITVTPTSTGTVTVPAGAATIDPSNTIAESNEANNASPSGVSTAVRTAPLPQANNDSYTAGENTPLTVSAGTGILSNDTGSPLTIISPTTAPTPQTSLPANYPAGTSTYLPPLTATTVHGGTVVVNPDGSFTYTPPANYTGPDSFSYTVSDAVQLYKTDLPVLGTFGGVSVTAGGFGSSLFPVPGSTDEFYGLTDRGPNVDGSAANTKVEPIPSFVPAIGKFRFVNGQAILEQYIPLTAANGTPYSGRVNSQATTGETIFDLNGNPLSTDPNGYDSEGLVALPDGTFWVSDEYGPFLTHFDATGKQIGRLSPFDGSLPAELQFRVPNKGMEGLTITPDGSMLVGMMQATLRAPDLPNGFDATTETAPRIVTYQLTGPNSGQLHEYLYMLNTNKTGVSEITALSSTQFVVDERDGKLPPGSSKVLYLIDITGATDVGPNSPLIGGTTTYNGSAGGLLFNGSSIEKLLQTGGVAQNTTTATATLASKGITVVAKSTYLDVVGLLNTLSPMGTFFAHDKVEGEAIVKAANGDTLVVLSNDNDFGISGSTGSGPFGLVAKFDGSGRQDDGEYLVINLSRLPAVTSTATVTFNVIVPNKAPSFTAGPSQTVLNTAGAQTIPGWATNISAGAGESGQTVSFVVTANNPSLFAVQPAISANGTLTFTPAAGAVGTALVTVTLKDNGGTLGGGVDTSAAQTLTINILSAQTPPTSAVTYTVTGASAGGVPEVRVFLPNSQTALYTFLAFPGSFLGGVRVATVDVNGDQIPDIIVAAGPGGRSQVMAIDGSKLNQTLADGEIAPSAILASFYAFDPNFNGGVFVAAGLTSAGKPEIVVGADAGGGPQVMVIDGTKLTQKKTNEQIADSALFASFYGFDPGFQGGVRVALGDVNADGVQDVVVAAGPGGGPQVMVIDGGKLSVKKANGQIDTPAILSSFFAVESAFAGGLFVAAGDLNGDRAAEVVVGSDAGRSPTVRVYNGKDLKQIADFFAFNSAFLGGVRVTLSDRTGDGRPEIVAAAGAGGNPQVASFDGVTFKSLENFYAADASRHNGLFVS